MAQRRFGPLVLSVLLATLVVLARLAQVQLGQHGVWAAEADKLVRSGSVLPFRRGEIRDRRGAMIAYDESIYTVELVYREFRRLHPLGEVAHAASALELRAVPLEEARLALAPWARALCALTPAELDAFGRGEALSAGELSAAATGEPAREQRWGRRNDLAFYIPQLLGLSSKERGALRKLAREGVAGTYLELAARVRGAPPEELALALEQRIAGALADLERLGTLLQRAGENSTAGEPSAWIVARLERWRRAMEDAAASQLFEEAAGFDAGRLEPQLLAQTLDLAWLGAMLRWDPPRTREWMEGARRDWLEALEELHVERLLLEVELAGERTPLCERVLERWARLFASRAALERAQSREGLVLEEIEDLRDLVVFSELPSLFDVRVPRTAFHDIGHALFDIGSLEEVGEPDSNAARRLARVEAWSPPDVAAADSGELAERSADWTRWAEAWADGNLDRRFLRQHSLAVLEGWDAQLQADVAALLAAARTARSDAPGPLELAPARLDQARERSQFVLKDRGNRPFTVAQAPDYELVHLLTRYPERFAGFQVQEGRERVHVGEERQGDRGRTELRSPIALLLGNVHKPRLRDVFLDEPLHARLAELRTGGLRTPEEESEFEWLVRRVGRGGAERGGDGIEGHFDHLLSGRNGYRERIGLQRLEENPARAQRMEVPPEDGLDLELTLDLDLQRAALDTLAHPAADPEPDQRDDAWLARPTGAIVLLAVNGDVLAAASYPDFTRAPAEEGARVALRDQPFERTLRIPAFQPPGSVFKPFVAAWAIEHAGLDPRERAHCGLQASGRPGYGGVHCRGQGHGSVDLRDALKQSCNSYFARLGERHLDSATFSAMTHAFGFGASTGVRPFEGGRGLFEDTARGLQSRTLQGRERLLAANGLSVVEATPMQVARGMAGLATGELPRVRMVRRAGESEFPSQKQPLPLSPATLAQVRAGMRAVAMEPGGSAYEALGPGNLGFSMAAKTGSADLEMPRGGVERRVRKHTWLASYFPVERPVAVLIVFLEDTLATSSKSAIWVARQYLSDPAVRAWLAETGVLTQ